MLMLIFESVVKRYSNDNELTNNPWKFREKLIDIANERWRMDCLTDRFLRPALNNEIKTTLKTELIRFLRTNDKDSEISNDNSLAVCLYSVRNIVIHRQYLIGSTEYGELHVINDLLLRFIYELLMKFNKEHGINCLTTD